MRKLSEFSDSHLRIFERPAPPDSPRDAYLIGICGTGMGAVAGLMVQAGFNVRGSDAAAYPPMSDQLAKAGIPILEGYSANNLDDRPDVVVVGNACVPTHPEAAAARERGLPQLSMPEAIARYFLQDRHSVVVAGTHGKTTTTGILVHILKQAGLDPGYLIGGIPVGEAGGFHLGRSDLFVIEGDEYDSAYFDKRPKFWHYRPRTAIVTSMEFDHADIYADWGEYRGAFRKFAALVDPDGLLILCGDDPAVRDLHRFTKARTLLYGMGLGMDICAREITSVRGEPAFTLSIQDEAWAGLRLPMSGQHNLLNALAACTAAWHLGAPDFTHHLASFAGMHRRQEVIGTARGVTVVDDFAHHPSAVRATIASARTRWTSGRIIAIFEPRSNSSRRKVFEEPYAEAFMAADLAYFVPPPFRHNDDCERFFDVERLATKVNDQGTPARVQRDQDQLLRELGGIARPGDVMLCMSNGSFGGLQHHLVEHLSAS